MNLGFQVSARPAAPAEARRVLDRLAELLTAEQLETLKLLVTELVTNSLRHCPVERNGWRIAVLVEHRDEVLHVRVTDPGSGFRRDVVPPPPLGISGRGLFLVECLAERWGVEDRDGTCVWFDFAIGSYEELRS